MDLSIVIPVYNEEKNVALLHQSIRNTLDKTDFKYEIVFVDDGSTDNTFNILNNLKKVKIIKFRKNFGQTAAMMAGFKEAKGSVIVSMDGDLQNDPSDIPKLIEKLNEGYDAVSGWRYNRKDSFSKVLFSKFANSFRQLLIKDPVHDSGCSLRAYKKECLSEIELYGEMHRYIPAILNWKGFKLSEIKVNHFPRKNGKTKYNMWRIHKGFMDLMNVWFWRKYSSRPLHIFGGSGLFLTLLGFILGVTLLIARQIYGYSLGQSQLPLLAVLMVVIGVQFFISGLLADISIKNYYGHNGRKTYSIEKILEK